MYCYGLVLTRRAYEHPMWQPRQTPDTVEDVAEPPSERSDPQVWTEFAGLAAVVAVVGWVIGTAGLSIADRTGLSGSLVGATFTAVVTSLPELVTVVTAVRIGAVTLAVGDIVGANTFDGPGGAPHRLRRRRDPRPLRDRHRLAVRPG